MRVQERYMQNLKLIKLWRYSLSKNIKKHGVHRVFVYTIIVSYYREPKVATLPSLFKNPTNHATKK